LETLFGDYIIRDYLFLKKNKYYKIEDKAERYGKGSWFIKVINVKPVDMKYPSKKFPIGYRYVIKYVINPNISEGYTNFYTSYISGRYKATEMHPDDIMIEEL